MPLSAVRFTNIKCNNTRFREDAERVIPDIKPIQMLDRAWSLSTKQLIYFSSPEDDGIPPVLMSFLHNTFMLLDDPFIVQPPPTPNNIATSI
jgi:hypothetical protein